MPQGGYAGASNRFTRRDSTFVLKATGAETSSTTGSAVEIDDGAALYIKVDVTAASGTTPTMTVVIEGSDDGTNWFTLGTFGANGHNVGSVATAPSNFTTTATVRGAVVGAAFMRYRSVIGGTTPSFTYTVNGSYAF